MDFCPNIRCPNCGNSFPVKVSGFGRLGYNTRWKHCTKCGKDFILEAYVSVCKIDESIPDLALCGIKHELKDIRLKRKKLYQEKQNQYQTLAAKVIEEQKMVEILFKKQTGPMQ